MTQPYVGSLFLPTRRRTREVKVGEVGIGGDNPIRVQSMTNTDTLDALATVEQTQALAKAGCEIVRVTVPSQREAEKLVEIRKRLAERGVVVPLVADIHFTPNAAMVAVEHVEKIRVNPGNYADKKRFDVRAYTDAEYEEEMQHVAERFRPLVRRCKELGRSMRIGTNHGSLSDRIMNRFGDTPEGMVASAVEFLDVCEDERFFDVIFSMKASNTQVAIHAYRRLAAELERRAPGEPSYPFHVGVTEAGDGEDGRIKSAIGIGALLEDGIGDTIRVSLTEDPVLEIPVAAALARRAEGRWASASATPTLSDSSATDEYPSHCESPYAHDRRKTKPLDLDGLTWGGSNPVRVELDLGPIPANPGPAAKALAQKLSTLTDVSCEGLVFHADGASIGGAEQFLLALREAGVSCPLSLRCTDAVLDPPDGIARLLFPLSETTSTEELAGIAAQAAERALPLQICLTGDLDTLPGLVERSLTLRSVTNLRLLFSVECALPVHAHRRVAARLRAADASDVLLVLTHDLGAEPSEAANQLDAAVDLGSLLCDGLGDGLTLVGFADPARAVTLAYRILQGARLRTSWTEFISCPSCGRTLFDLEEATARIKARTGHLKGLKIAIMGCIVNGPGEMADADFGYVGAGVRKINLYVGKEIVERNIAEDEASDRLVDLIRREGRWVDPS